jgi:Transposase, Mutator family
VLAVAEGSKEDKASWTTFLRHLKERGLKGVRLPNAIPFAPGSQITLFGGKGSNGQSVAKRMAKIAMAHRMVRRFLCRTSSNVSFIGESACEAPGYLQRA